MKKILTISSLCAVVLSGCSTKNEQLRIESNQALNCKQIESQADVAQAALKYLAETQGDDKVSLSGKHHRVPPPSVQAGKKEYPAGSCAEVCRYCSIECYEKCPEMYNDKFPNDPACLSNQPPNGWEFDGKKWICDDVLLPGLCDGAGTENYEGAGTQHNITVSPSGNNNNVVVQVSPRAQVNYGSTSEGGSGGKSELLRSIAGFIDRDPIKVGNVPGE